MPSSQTAHPSPAEQRAVAEQVLNTMADIQILPGEIRNEDVAFPTDSRIALLLYGAPTNQLLLLECSPELAFEVTARLFGRSRPISFTDVDVTDTLAELVNMIGGNLKALMPSQTCVSLPSVLQQVEEQELVSHAGQLSKVWLNTSFGLLCLTFLNTPENLKLPDGLARFRQM